MNDDYSRHCKEVIEGYDFNSLRDSFLVSANNNESLFTDHLFMDEKSNTLARKICDLLSIIGNYVPNGINIVESAVFSFIRNANWRDAECGVEKDWICKIIDHFYWRVFHIQDGFHLTSHDIEMLDDFLDTLASLNKRRGESEDETGETT